MGIREQRNLLDRHEISVKELTECYLNRIETYDPALQSYITVTKEQAYQDAETAQKKIDDLCKSRKNLIIICNFVCVSYEKSVIYWK